jgi:MYXO-CTERM domain-containing protein
VVTAAASCDGAGRCPAPQQASCNAYVCGPSACKTSCAADGDCSGGGFCVQGVCHSRNDPSMWVVAGAGGCSETGPAAWTLLLVALGFALRRRKKAIGVLALVLAGSSGARAQSATFTADRFQPGPGAYDVLGVWSADTQDHLQWHASLLSSYARDPLRLVAIGRPDQQVQLLHGQSMLHFAASVGLWDRFEVGAVLPLALAQGSDGAPMLGGPVSNPVASAGLGDLRVLPKARLLTLSGLTLGFGLPFTIPIGRQDAFLGAGGLTVTPTLLAELEDVLPLRLLANLGVAVRGGRSLGNLEVGNALTYGLAAEMPFLVKNQRLAALATLSGEAGLSQGGSVERPLELLAGLRWTALGGVDLSAGGGPGLTDGYGTPSYRLFFSISLNPGALGYRPPSIPQPAILVEAPPRPARVIETAAEPVALSRTLELARIDEDHVELLAPVLFQKDSDILIVQSRAVLDAAVALLREHPDLVMLRVEGHTDGRGDPRHNLDLSKRRAQAVRRYLVKKGVASSRLEAEGYGSERPIAANDTAEGRARNRRVEMLILRRSQAVSAASSDE